MKKSLASIGLTASLLGGGVVGATMFAPTLAGAQDDAAVESERPEPGEHLAEVLAPLVADGTIVQAQADAVIDAMVEAAPQRLGHGGGFGHFGGGARVDNLAEVTGIDADVWLEGLQDGQTPAEIAAANGSSEAALIDALVGEAEEHLVDAVDSGRLTQEEADERLVQVTERITEGVNGEGRFGGGFGRGFHGGPGGGEPTD